MASYKIKVLFSLVLCTVLCVNAAVVNLKIQKRIVGGSDARPNQFRYMVGISTQIGFTQWFICGGAIISAHNILTSAGCVADYVKQPTKLTAILGSPSYGENDDFTEAWIEKIILHPQFISEHLINDIAILRTTEPMTGVNEVVPVELPGVDVTNENGIKAFVSGWGLLNVRNH